MAKKTLILIHGLNNQNSAFWKLGEALSSDFKVIYLRLPQHGPQLTKDFEKNIREFLKELTTYLMPNSSILAYSLGASYLQYCIEKKMIHVNLERIIYLSPALKTKMNLGFFKYLPASLIVPSLAPRELRLRPYSYSAQYRMLYLLTSGLELSLYPQIFADPQDELISLTGLEFSPIERRELSYGEHHLSFHPKYYTEEKWQALISEISVRLLRQET